MNEITLFDTIGHLQLRAVQPPDTPVVVLGQQLSQRRKILREVWVVPTDGDYFTPEHVQAMHFSTVGQLRDFYDIDLGLTIAPAHVVGKEMDLLGYFACDLVHNKAHFNYTIMNNMDNESPLLSIVFGDRDAMVSVFAKGLRRKTFR